MAVQSSPHWTDNEEVLERYVLGRLDPQARRVLEEHLATCTHCREAVNHETELAAGIRRLGREQLKARLARRLATAVRPSVPWPHVISAAAVLVIAMGVAVYTFWTPLETWYEGSLTRTVPQAVDTPAASAGEKESDKGVAGRDDIAARNEALLEKIDRAKGDDRKIVEAPAEADEAEPPQPAANRVDKTFAVTGAFSEASAWVQGVIVPLQKDEAEHRADALERLDQLAEEKLRARPTEAQKARQQEGASSRQSVWAELRQQPFDSLPENLQQVQLAQRTVETLVEKTPDGLRLTFFMDPPIPEEELQAAQLQAVTEDSLLVIMPSQQIAYKIPAALGTVQAIQLKTKQR